MLALLSAVSLRYYRRGLLCKPATTASLAVAAAVGWRMWERYSATGKLMPAGAVAGLSAAMVLFYAWSLALGPAPAGGKKKAGRAGVATRASARKPAAPKRR